MDTNVYLYYFHFFRPLDKEVRCLILSFVISSYQNYFAKMEIRQKVILRIFQLH